MTAYYNEIDPFKAEVLREAIKAGAIAPGDVDERSIADVQPAELVGYAQCHFFGGGGFWSLALRLAGWPDDRPVWTGSCPCPSFSVAGKGAGFADPRHLWPEWYRLIRERRPRVVFGEQADAAVGFGWLDLVCHEMEAAGYAIAAAILGAHSAGAPHIRHRIYFGAHANGKRGQQERGCAPGDEAADGRAGRDWREPDSDHIASGHEQVGSGSEPLHPERRPLDVNGCDGRDRAHSGRQEAHGEPGTCGEVRSDHNAIGHRRGTLGDDDSGHDGEFANADGDLGIGYQPVGPRLEGHFGNVREWRGPGWLDPLTARSVAEAGATRGFWADCDWWYGRDGKYRPIGPGLFPLASGSPARVGRLRMFGDAICVETAKEFIAAYLETEMN